MKIQSIIRAGAALAAAVLFSSCFEVTNNLALNPDGSGKFVYKTTMPAMPMNLNFGGDAEEAPDMTQVAKDAAEKLVKGSSGVDVWEKLDFKVTDDGKMTINASGYFKDVTKLKVGDGDNGGPSLGEGITFKKGDDGKLTLEMTMDMDQKEEAAGEEGGEQPKLTGEQIAEKIKESRAQWGQAKGMMAGMLGTMKMDINIKMPGKIVSTTNFKKKSDDVASLGFTGQSMIDMMDKVIMDDELAKKVVAEGGDLMGDGPPPVEGDAMNELLFGEKGGLKIVSEGGKPHFDYAEHAAKAKAGQSAELKALLAE